MSFKESWLIPKDLIQDFLEYRKRAADEDEDNKEEKQQGGNVLFSHKDDDDIKETTRHKLVKNYLNQTRNRSQVDPNIPNLPPTSSTSIPRINLNLVKSFFPEAERFKIASVVSFINQKIPFRIRADKDLALTIDNKYFWNSSLPDVLMFLFGINRRYVSEERTVKYRGITYGIPTGTEEFVSVLQEAEPALSKLSFSKERLKILEINGNLEGLTTLDDDDDDNDDNDDDDDGNNDNNDTDNEEDGRTPWRKPKPKGRRRRIQPNITPQQLSFSPTQQQEGQQQEQQEPAAAADNVAQEETETPLEGAVGGETGIVAPDIHFSPEPFNELVEDSFRAHGLPSAQGPAAHFPASAPPAMLNRDAFTQRAIEEMANTGAKSKVSSLNKWGQDRDKAKKEKQQREMRKLAIAEGSSFIPALANTKRKASESAAAVASKEKKKKEIKEKEKASPASPIIQEIKRLKKQFSEVTKKKK